MANRIKRTDIFAEEDIFKGIRDSAKKTLSSLDTINTKLKETARTLKSALSTKNLDSTKAIKDLAVAIEKANQINQHAVKISALKSKASQEQAKAEQQLLKIEQERQKANQQSIKTDSEKERLAQQKLKTSRATTQEAEREAKSQAKITAEAQKQNSAYYQLATAVRNLKNASKEYGAQLLALEQSGKKGTQEWYKLSQAYSKVTQEAQKGDAQLKRLDKTVGDNFRNVGNYQQALGGLQQVFGLFGIAVGAGQVIQNVSKFVMDYEVQNSRLASVLGTVTSKTADLQAVQRKLGFETAFTAGDVARLQVEMAKLGFTQEQIIKSSEGVLKLAGATQTDIARSAEVAGSTLRAFGLDAGQMMHVTDVMAKSFSTSALEMENFANSMKYVAPIANLAGVSLEETSAMLGVLANSGVKGSQAGTSLRRILTEMARTGKPVKEALAQVVEGGIGLVDAFDEVGRTAMTSLAILGNNTAQVDELTLAYNKCDGATSQMYDTMTDNLQGGVDRLSSAWESYVLDVNEGSGASEKMQSVLDYLATNLRSILDVVASVLSIWVKYKIITLAQIGYNKLLATSFITTARNLGGMKGAVMGLRGAMVSLGTAIKNNIVGIGIYAIYTLYQRFASLNEALGKNKELNKSIASAQLEVARNTQIEKNEVDALFKALKETNKGSKERAGLIDSINKKYDLTLQNLQNEKLFVKQVDGAYKDLMATLKQKSELESKRIAFEVSSRSLTELEMEMLSIENKMKGFNEILFSGIEKAKAGGGTPNANLKVRGGTQISILVGGIMNNLLGVEDKFQLIDQYNALAKSYEEMKKTATKYESAYNTAQAKTMGKSLKVVTKEDLATLDNLDGTGTGDGETPNTDPKKIAEIREYELAMQSLNEYVQKQIELQEELRAIYSDAEFLTLAKEVDGIINNAVLSASNKAKAGKNPFDFVIDGEIYDQTELKIIELFNKAKELAKKKTDYEISEIKRKYSEEQKEAEKSVTDNFNEQKKEYTDRLKDLEKSDPKDVNKTASKKNLNAELAKIEKEYQAQLLQLGVDKAKRDADQNTEVVIAEAKLSDQIVGINKEQDDQIFDYNEKLNEGIIQNTTERNDALLKESEEEVKNTKEYLDGLKERWSEINEAVKSVSDFFVEQSNRRIAQIERERDATEKNYDLLKELAINGNITAQQSLAEEQRIMAEKNKQIAREQKLQQRLKLVSTVFEVYSKNVGALKEGESSTKALGNTIKDISLLTAFINSLPSFEAGTEDTGTNGKGVDGRGGFKAILHPNERVVPKHLNSKMGKITNEELAKIAQEHRNAELTPRHNQKNSDQTNEILIKKIEDLTQVIKDKPETDYKIAEISSSLIEVVKKTKQKNTTVFNRYRIQP